jgi:RNA polymerase sigma factor (sigma-70 family)
VGFSYPHTQTASLADLIAAAQAHDSDDSPAMGEIIRRFTDKARDIARAVCLRPADHEDVVSAALLALTRAVRRHQTDRGGFTTYAVTSMTGAARRESKRLACPEETSLAGPDLVLVAESVPRAVPLVATSRPDQADWGEGCVAKIVASLPKPMRTLLAERYIHDQDLGGIADRHGCSVSAVSQRLGTAHRRICTMIPSTTTLATAA